MSDQPDYYAAAEALFEPHVWARMRQENREAVVARLRTLLRGHDPGAVLRAATGCPDGFHAEVDE